MANRATMEQQAGGRAADRADRRRYRRADDELNLIFVFADAPDVAKDIRNLLEFMDTHRVEIAEPDGWRAQLNGRELSAVFMAPDVPDETRERLVDDIGSLDSAISIVVVDPPSDVPHDAV